MADSSRLIRFGVFELDLAARELRRNGARVKLQDQPLEVLAALVERPGEVVAKEELRARIWGDDVHVDFDRSLATAVTKVRHALGDSATRPRFVETVPKRGYRFLAELPVGEPVRDEPAAREPGPRRRIPPAVIAAAGALLLVGGWVVSGRSSGADAAVRWSEPRRITSDSGLTFQPAISRDGTLLAYASDRAGEGHLDIWLQQIGGGEPIRLTDSPADEQAPQFSPDGRSIVFQSGAFPGAIFTIPSLGGEPRRIAESGIFPRFSPDGRWIAFVMVDPDFGSVYLAPTRGGTLQKLALKGFIAQNHYPVWSPDGSALLVATTQRAAIMTEPEWRLISAKGRDLGASGAIPVIRAFMARTGRDFFAARPFEWDAAGWVYFARWSVNGNDLWRIRVDPISGRVAGEPEEVLNGPGDFQTLSMSRDGRMVFSNQTKNMDLWSLDVDADRAVATAVEPVRLTSAPGLDANPTVSLDGRRVAFASWRSSRQEAWLLDVTTRRERRILGAAAPRITADGERVATMMDPSANPEAGRRLAIVSWGGGLERDLDLPGAVEGVFTWLPDNSGLLAGFRTGAHTGLGLLDLQTGESTELLSEEGLSFFQPEVSPDGRWIAWMTVGASEAGVWAAPFRGAKAVPRSEWIRISDERDGGDKPGWSPRGDLLYYLSYRDGFACIYAQPLARETKRPLGELRAVFHSHDTRTKIGNEIPNVQNVAIACDRIVFSMTELTANIWMMEPLP